MGQAGSTASQNVLMLGLDGSGKSSILARLLGDDPRTVLPTYGFTIRAFQLGDTRERAVLKLWDQGGTAPMRRYWPAYYAKAHALCFVIDASDHRHLATASAVLQEVLDSDDLLGVPLLVLANKQDAPNAIPASEIEELLHLGSIRDRTWNCLPTSALRGQGLTDGMSWLADAHAGALLANPNSSRMASRLARLGGSFKRGSFTAASPRDDAEDRDESPQTSRRETSRKETRGRSARGRSRAARQEEEDDDDEEEEEEAAAPSAAPARRTRTSRARRKQAASDSEED